MRNKERSDAITSGQHGPKLPGLGRAPTSGVCGLWPQRHCLPFSDTPENGAKKQRLLLANLRFSGMVYSLRCPLYNGKLLLCHRVQQKINVLAL